MSRPRRWRLVASRYVHSDSWVRLRIDSCVNGRGEPVGDYHVLEYPEWVNIVALTPTGELVLVREYRHGARQVMIGLPSGVAHDGEVPRAAARRELAEETGLVSARLVRLGKFFANPSNQTNSVTSFLAIHVTPGGATAWDTNEHVQVVWAPFVETLERVARGATTMQGLHLAALHLAMLYILGGREQRLHTLQRDVRRWFVAMGRR